jgi:hypothetical protein
VETTYCKLCRFGRKHLNTSAIAVTFWNETPVSGNLPTNSHRRAVFLHRKFVHLSICPFVHPEPLRPITQAAYKEEPTLNNIHMDRTVLCTHTYLITSTATFIFLWERLNNIHSVLLNMAWSVTEVTNCSMIHIYAPICLYLLATFHCHMRPCFVYFSIDETIFHFL